LHPADAQAGAGDAFILREERMSLSGSDDAISSEPIAVIKIGGSILKNSHAYRRAAVFIRHRHKAAPHERLIVVVSAQEGTTDALERIAKNVVPSPKAATLDLLWSTGELRSVALLTLQLQALGVHATGLNIHETGLIVSRNGAGLQPSRIRLDRERLCGVLGEHGVAVVPGFLATDGLHSVVSLGRGGSDLTAVLLAAGLGASLCELIKDVPGYFTSDPHRNPNALPVPFLTFEHALELADDGCDLVQRKAIEAAAQFDLPLVIRSLNKNANVSRISATIPGTSWSDSVSSLAVAP
jgi:aspartate kinase